MDRNRRSTQSNQGRNDKNQRNLNLDEIAYKMLTRSGKQTNNGKHNKKTKNQRETNSTERVTRSVANNHDTKNREQRPKGISKRVKTAYQIIIKNSTGYTTIVARNENNNTSLETETVRNVGVEQETERENASVMQPTATQNYEPQASTSMQSDEPQASTSMQKDEPQPSTSMQKDEPQASTPTQNDEPQASTFMQNIEPQASTFMHNNVPQASTFMQNNEPQASTSMQNAEPHASTSMQNNEPQASTSMQNDEPQASSPVHTEQVNFSVIPRSKQRLVIVVDTNILMMNLTIVKKLVTSYFEGFFEKPNIFVPWHVINELEFLKDNIFNPIFQVNGTAAVQYLYEVVPKRHWIEVQSLIEDRDHLFDYEVPDDAVLNCCLQQRQQGNIVILLSDDRNLCNRTMKEGIYGMSSLEVVTKIEERPFNCYPPGQIMYARYITCKSKIYNLLSTILRNEMHLTQLRSLHTAIIHPPWTLLNVLDCLLAHWMPVFKTIFPKIKLQLEELRNTVHRLDNTRELAPTDITSFKDLCLNIAHKCQIIPDYMDVAIGTVASLKETRHVDFETKDIGEEQNFHKTFDGIYVYFSSYCAKLCSHLGIRHCVEDRSTCGHLTADELLGLFPVINGRLLKFTNICKEALCAGSDDVLYHLLTLNNFCATINPNYAFMEKTNMSPAMYLNKHRDLFIRNYNTFCKITRFLRKCSFKIRENAMIGI